MNKFYIYSDESDYFEEDIKKYLKLKEKDPTLKLVVVAEKEEVLDDNFSQDAYQLTQKFSEYGIRPHDIIIALEGKDSDLTPLQWDKVKTSCEKLKKHGLEFGFDDFDAIWSIEQVEHANNQIAESADKLRGKNFSPLEKLMSAYLEVTKRNYKYEDAAEHLSQSRSVYGVLNSDAIVCVGYASLLKAIMEKEGDKNVQLYFNRVACSKDNKHLAGTHRNLIVYIKDEKYKLDGYYYIDPTWDCSKGQNQEFNLNYFLVPLKDIQHIQTHIRAIDAKLEPTKPSKNKTHITVKRRRAIAKNRYRTYNRASAEVHSSFSSDKFTMSNSLRDSIAENENVYNLIMEYLDMSDDLLNSLNQEELAIQRKYEQVEQYLIENNVNFLSDTEKQNIEQLYKSGASAEVCMQYAEGIVSKLRLGTAASVDTNAFKNEYLKKIRQGLNKNKSIDFTTDMLKALKIPREGEDTEAINQIIAEYEKQLEKYLAEVNLMMSVLEKYLDEHPDALYLLNDISIMDPIGSDDIILSLILLKEVNEESIISEIEKCVANNQSYVKYELGVSKIGDGKLFNQGKEDEAAKKRQMDQMLVYEAMCDSSKPIDLSTMTRALGNVLRQNYPNASPDKIKTVVGQIVGRNSKRAGACFNKGASNAFYEYGEAQTQTTSQQAQQK